MGIKRLICKHEYVFDKKLCMVTPAARRGVCKKCGKPIVVTEEEYKEKYQSKQ